jgi:hypothetical protein
MNSGNRWARSLPLIDGVAALSAGALLLVVRGVLTHLYGVSSQFLTTIAVVNLLYSVLGLTLGMLGRRPAWLLAALICANLGWAAICIVLTTRAPVGMTLWGHAHLVGEGASVAVLAVLELRYRRSILELRSSASVRRAARGAPPRQGPGAGDGL